MKKFIIIAVVVIIVFGAGAGLLISKKVKGEKSANIYSEEVNQREIMSIVTAFGSVTPKAEVEISSKISGEITELFVEEGDSVKKGDKLLTIDRKLYDTRVEQAQASLDQAKASLKQQMANLKKYEIDFERNKQMYQKGLISKSEMENLETQLEVQKAVVQSQENSVKRQRSTVDEAYENLSYTTITSPQEGIVIGLQNEVGEYVIVGTMNNTGSVIMTIAQLDSMEVEVKVDESEVVNIHEEQDVFITFDAIPDTSFAGRVRKIGNKAYIENASQDETIANFLVEIDILEVPKQIRSGMSVTAEIVTAKANDVFTVPIQAVITGMTAGEKERMSADDMKNMFAKNGKNGMKMPGAKKPSDDKAKDDKKAAKPEKDAPLKEDEKLAKDKADKKEKPDTLKVAEEGKEAPDSVKQEKEKKPEKPMAKAPQKPNGANGSFTSEEYVFVVIDGKAKKIPVETGIADENYIEIKRGLKGGEKVITGPYKEVRMLYDDKPVEEKSAWGNGMGGGSKGFSVRIGN